VACRGLNVSRSGYYEWASRPVAAREQENELLSKQIQQVHAESRGTYGWPRVRAELTLGLGLVVNHKRVARLMREAGIQGLYRRRRRGTTVRDPPCNRFNSACLGDNFPSKSRLALTQPSRSSGSAELRAATTPQSRTPHVTFDLRCVSSSPGGVTERAATTLGAVAGRQNEQVGRAPPPQ